MRHLLPILLLPACADWSAVEAVGMPRLTAEPTAESVESGIHIPTDLTLELGNSGQEAATIELQSARLLDAHGSELSNTVPVAIPEGMVQVLPEDSIALTVQVTPDHPTHGSVELLLSSTPSSWPTELRVRLPITVLADYDQDGADHLDAGGDDCDDTDPTVHPGATEVWYDGIDQTCDGNDLDADADGTDHRWDCNDEDPSVYPGATEVWYDGVDQDCDGNDADFDEDGYTSIEVGGPDCDDSNPLVHPGSADGGTALVDDDCDGLIDEDAAEYGMVVVSEVMRLPSDGAPAAWFEVTNITDTPLNLSGWTVHTNTSWGVVRVPSDDSPPLAADGQLVLCNDPTAATAAGVPCDAIVEPWPEPHPAADAIELRVDGLVIDSVGWNSSWPGAVGVSTVLDARAIDADLNDAKAAWCASTLAWDTHTDLGSPGAPNPTCAALP